MSLHRVYFTDPASGRTASATFYEERAFERFADLLHANGYGDVHVVDVADDERVVYRPSE